MSHPVVIATTPGQPYAEITREFDASVGAVFRAHALADMYKNWIGPRGLETTVTHWGFRSGGGYAFEQVDPEGNRYAFRGVFHTVRENEIIIQTFEWDGAPDEVSMDVLRFEELPDGRSRIVDHSVFATVEAMEGMMSQGGADGLREGYERLDELLAS
ncbi:MAG: SRPBCC family protein [Microthrixaceae bacterium]|nr:SRPBCC family protein [Microthrixaceae bacterium]